jgi:radical SAM protein with 4Fe4S-binding SPASM domain
MALATNGTLLSEKKIMQFKRSGLKEVTLPIDGVRETHDKIRGKGSFDAMLRAAEGIKKAGLTLVFSSCIMKMNLAEIPQILEICTKLGAKRCEVFHYIAMGRGLKELPDEELDEKQFIQSLYSIYEEQRHKRELEIYLTTACQYWVILNQKFKSKDFVPDYFSKMIPGCGAGISMFCIKPNGDVTPCPMLDVVVGNVRKTSLKKLWHSEVFEELRLRNVKGRCGVCKYKNICMGCRARALLRYGDFLAEDPLCGFFMPMEDK